MNDEIDTHLRSPRFIACSSTEQVPLSFAIHQEKEHHLFYKNSQTAVHGSIRSGSQPRVLIAFVEGHSGACLIFEKGEETQHFSVMDAGYYEPAELQGFKGLKLNLLSSTPLRLRRDSIRFGVRNIREFIEENREHPLFQSNWYVQDDAVLIERKMFDGISSTLVRLQPGAETLLYFEDETIFLEPAGGNSVSFILETLNNITPCTPILGKELFREEGISKGTADEAAFSFLAFEEQFAAGSWRFLQGTFTRDIIFTLTMVMDVLQPRVVELALGSTISRIAGDATAYLGTHEPPSGTASHEDSGWDWGDYLHLLQGRQEKIGIPLRDYRMIDTSFLPCISLANYLRQVPEASDRLLAFLNSRADDGKTYREKVLLNLALGVKRARPFAEHPVHENLIGFYEGEYVGDWRDSTAGHGMVGVYPYYVNRSLVPAHLRAAAEMVEAGVLDVDGGLADEARTLAGIWEEEIPALYEVEVPSHEFYGRLQLYCAELDVPLPDTIPDGPLVFPALSLTRSGTPLPVMHSDDCFVLNYNLPSEEELAGILRRLTLPFPAGLIIPNTGVVVANPAYASEEVKRHFTDSHYHGTVIWSWQQAFFITGIRRQLQRKDLSREMLESLLDVETSLWQLVLKTESFRNAELWGWKIEEQKRFAPKIFDQKGTESNIIQLWSTVFFALKP